MAGSPQHATLVAATVTTFTFDVDYRMVEVLIVSGSDPVYFRVDGPAPGIEAEGSDVVPTIGGLQRESVQRGPTVVRLISAGTPKVSVRGVPTA